MRFVRYCGREIAGFGVFGVSKSASEFGRVKMTGNLTSL